LKRKQSIRESEWVVSKLTGADLTLFGICDDKDNSEKRSGKIPTIAIELLKKQKSILNKE